MIPNDFRLKSVYGLTDVPDWPISYDDLEHWYCDAEDELGVSGDDEEWNGMLGAILSRRFQPEIVKSFSDQLQHGLDHAIVPHDHSHTSEAIRLRRRRNCALEERPASRGTTTVFRCAR